MAEWLDKTFLGFDKSIFAFMHALNDGAHAFLNPMTKFVSFFGEGGWLFIAIAAILLLFKKTRRHGLAMGMALAIGAVITNILLKNLVGRARPFTRAGEPFYDWWVAAGSSFESSESFPSGHTTAAFAASVAFLITGDKRYSWTGLVFAVLMGFSRMYLIVHYPTDVLAGLIVGTAGGIAGALLCGLVYRKAGGKFRNLLENFSIVTLCEKSFRKKSDQNAEESTEENSSEETEAQSKEPAAGTPNE